MRIHDPASDEAADQAAIEAQLAHAVTRFQETLRAAHRGGCWGRFGVDVNFEAGRPTTIHVRWAETEKFDGR